MRLIFNALLFGGGKVNAANLGYGLAAAWLATADVHFLVTVLAGVGAVFLLGREILHDYVFTSAYLRAARYQKAQLDKELTELLEREGRKGAEPFTEKDVEELRKKLGTDEDDGPGITAGV